MQLKKHWQLLVYVLGSCLLRAWNFKNSLYFIYDQGRDALVLDKILHGHPILVGPTSGLDGFFLGPLWYYLGLPGAILTHGHPYGICLWYMAISCLALPLYWILAHKLFTQKSWALLLAISLAIIPGSLTASLMIWNPLLAAPLMLGTALSFWQAHEQKSRGWLILGFLCLALTLQSEFAYGIFFLVPLYLGIRWLSGRPWKQVWKDYFLVAVVIGLTLLPQLAFEIRNHFLMTNTLLRNVFTSTNSVSWATQLQQRPQQLWDNTQHILIGANDRMPYFMPIFVILFLIGASTAFKNRSLSESTRYGWQLWTVFALLPYPFYLLWRGNQGAFYWYYLTCHFIFLWPVMLLGAWQSVNLVKKFPRLQLAVGSILIFFGLSILVSSTQNWLDTVAFPSSQGNLQKMLFAVQTLNEWAAEDPGQPFIVKTYTANVYTSQYDYLFSWFALKHHSAIPITSPEPDAKTWFILIENSQYAPKVLFEKWYTEARNTGHLTKTQQIGILTLEKWQK